MREAAVLLVGLALLVVPAGLAGAQSQSQDEPAVRASGSSATISYERTAGDQHANMTITFDANSSTFGNDLTVGNGSDRRTNAMDVQLQELAEFEDEDEDGEYDPDEKIVSSYRLSEDSEDVLGGPENGTVQWEDLNVSETTSDDGQSGEVVRGRAHFVGSSDPVGQLEEALGQQDNGTFGVNIYAFGEPATVNGTEVSPGQVKVSLLTENYPYARNDTKLVLATDASSELGLENASDAEHGVAAPDDIEGVDASLVYTWQANAKVDGAEQPVGTTRLDGNTTGNETSGDANASDTDRTYALSYPRGDRIDHDPVTGVQLEGTDQAFQEAEDTVSKTPGWGALTATLALGTVAIAAAGRHR